MSYADNSIYFMTMKMKQTDFFSSFDLALAAAIFLFYPLEAIDKENPRKAQFLFKKTADLEKLVEDYWHGDLRIEPQAYFNALRIIKARLYER